MSAVATTSRPRVSLVVERIGALWTLGVLVVIIVIFGVVNPAFLSTPAWIATAVAATQILLLAIGQTYVIATGGIDLSVGAVLGTSGMLSGLVMHALNGSVPAEVTIAVGAVVAVASGVAAGAVNGFVITVMGVTPIIATLGMLGVGTGAAYLIGDGQQIAGLPVELSAIGFTNVFGILPIPVLVSLIVAAIAWYVLARTRFGRRTLAIGSNLESARRAGIPTRWHITRVYMLSGLCAGLAGFLLIARLSAASPLSGSGAELNAIAAVVIGGTSLVGGRASLPGTVIGTAIIAVLQTGLVVAGVPPFWQYVAVGVVLVLAVWADRQRARLVSRRT